MPSPREFQGPVQRPLKATLLLNECEIAPAIGPEDESQRVGIITDDAWMLATGSGRIETELWRQTPREGNLMRRIGDNAGPFFQLAKEVNLPSTAILSLQGPLA